MAEQQEVVVATVKIRIVSSEFPELGEQSFRANVVEGGDAGLAKLLVAQQAVEFITAAAGRIPNESAAAAPDGPVDTPAAVDAAGASPVTPPKPTRARKAKA